VQTEKPTSTVTQMLPVTIPASSTPGTQVKTNQFDINGLKLRIEIKSYKTHQNKKLQFHLKHMQQQ